VVGMARALVRLRREDVPDEAPSRLEVLRAEADRIATVLIDEQDALAVAGATLAAALARLPQLAEIDADVAVGAVEPDVAEAAKREITETVEIATVEKERRARAVEVLRERVRLAGRAVADELLRECAGPLNDARYQLREAEAVLAARRSQLEVVQAAYEQVSADADDVRAAYDGDLRRLREQRAREKERQMRWALRQPREIIVQLPLAWQEEAYRRWDEYHAEAQAYRRKAEQERHGDMPRFDEPSDSRWRKVGSL
jgi:hypothetical protein